MPIVKDALVALAQVAKPHGLRGELRLKVFNRDSELLARGRAVVLELPSGESRPTTIAAARPINDALLVTFEGVARLEDAEALRGARVLIARAAFPQLEGDEFYACDVEGARVFVGDESEPLGTVESLLSYPTCDVLIIVTPAGRLEVPLLEGVVDAVDAAAGVVRVSSREALEGA